MGARMGEQGSTNVRDSPDRISDLTFYPVVIIGAGISGIAAGHHLKEKLGFNRFQIFDKLGGIGV
jgi:hypothetical protein